MGEDRGRVRRRLVDIAGSVLTALLVFAAVPTVLVTLVGDPLSGGLGHQWDHAARVAMTVLTIVAWVAWVACCTQLTRAVVHHVRRGHVGLPIGAPMTDRIAARIAIGILAVTSMGAPLIVASTSAGASTTAVVQAPAASAITLTPSVVAPPASATSAYVVRAGDSLWTIADTQLGDGADWTAIAALNLGRTMPDGRRFIDPSLIFPGWTLILPATDTDMAATADVVAPAPTPSPPPTPIPTPTSTLTPSTTPTTASSNVTPVTTSTPATAPAASGHNRPDVAPTVAHQRHQSSTLPELVALGLGPVACAALARRSRRRRLLREFDSSPEPRPAPSERAIDTDVLLQRFSDVPALAAFEKANCRLGQHLSDPARHAANIRAICVNSFGVDFWLAKPGQAPPEGFDLVEHGTAWHLPHRELDEQPLERPCFPIVLSIGDDDDGTWLLPMQPGAVLPIFGPAALPLWRAARRVQEAWSWADMVLVTEDPLIATREAQRFSTPPDASADVFPILFFGDPTRLSAATLAQISVVTTSPGTDADLSVLADHHGASIHPLARTVRPHLVTAETARLIDELVEVAPTCWGEPAPDSAARLEPEPAMPLITEDLADTADLGPGLVEVKLLTMTPRLDGLREELPPNRERRAVELVAYLALHRPDTITSDRLRTRVLGSGDADAAAKTLFNTATAARRAMGADDQGQPLFPPGTRTGHYRVSTDVTVDVQRAAGLASVGSAAEDPDLAIAHLRAALELIEGEPLANALSGYTWWESEGHGGRTAAVLVNAACNLAALAVQAGLFDLAQWGLDRARLVDPYSESLSRAAMQVAAAAGDADRLRREWRECQRRVDELDPGSSPSARTERLYGELAQQVLAS